MDVKPLTLEQYAEKRNEITQRYGNKPKPAYMWKSSYNGYLDDLKDKDPTVLNVYHGIKTAAVSTKYKNINFVPPKNVASEAARGLEYRRKAGGKGALSVSEAKKEGVGSGVQRAVNLKNRDRMSPETVRRMKAFFDRHQKNKAIDPKHKNEPWKDRGYVAWLTWGGDPGYAWAKKVVSQMEKADKTAKMASHVLMGYINHR